MNTLKLAGYIKDGKVEVDDVNYSDGRYTLKFYSDYMDVDKFLEEINTNHKVYVNQEDVTFTYEEITYDINGAFHEGGIEKIDELHIPPQDVTAGMLNKEIINNPKILKVDEPN